MNTQDDTSLGRFEERLLTELKAAVAAQSGQPSAQSDPVGPGRLGRVRLSRRALAGVAAAAVVSSTLAGGLVERELGRTAAAPVVTHASLDAFLNMAAAAALKSKDTTDWKLVYQGEVLREVQYGRGQPIECQDGFSLTPVTGLLDVTYRGPVTCPSIAVFRPPVIRTKPAPTVKPNPRPNPSPTRASVPPPPATPPVSAPPSAAPGGTAHRYYPDLSLLPTTPTALRAALYAAASRGPRYWGMTTDDKDAIFFGLITRILESGVSGPLRAAIYQALEQVPGVSITFGATDLAGRPGTGITFTEQGPRGLTNTTGFILSAHTYAFLGATQAGYDWHESGPPRYSSFAAAYLRVVTIIKGTSNGGTPGH